MKRLLTVIALAFLIASCENAKQCYITLDAKYNGKTYGAKSHQFTDTTSSNVFYPDNASGFILKKGKIYRLCLDSSLNIKELY